MEQIIGTKVKTHDNGYVGKVNSFERIYVNAVYRHLRGIEANEPYVAYAVQIDETPTGWSTVIASDEADVLKRYAV